MAPVPFGAIVALHAPKTHLSVHPVKKWDLPREIAVTRGVAIQRTQSTGPVLKSIAGMVLVTSAAVTRVRMVAAVVLTAAAAATVQRSNMVSVCITVHGFSSGLLDVLQVDALLHSAPFGHHCRKER